MRTKFLIVGAPRTGSTLLVRTLNTLDSICCHGELLGPDNVRGYEDGADLINMSKPEREARIKRLLEDRNSNPVGFIEQALTSDHAATGFKALYKSFLDPRWNEVISLLQGMENIHFIHLTRNNELRRFVSEQILLQGGANHSGAGGKSEVRMKVHVDIALFLQRSEELQRQSGELSAMLAEQSVLDISYEALATDTSSTVAQVCRFIGLDAKRSDIQPALKKVGANDLRDAVVNYEELLDHTATREMALRN
jgi:LPS sulfotransferase NodH